MHRRRHELVLRLIMIMIYEGARKSAFKNTKSLVYKSFKAAVSNIVGKNHSSHFRKVF
jgi:hypothetical protein